MLFSFSLVYQGEFTHQTGDKGGGCFGTDERDPIKKVWTDPDSPATCYKFYSDVHCEGKVVWEGCATTFPAPPPNFEVEEYVMVDAE
ncbi:4499_t:CDS:2 [Ambispora gerdemannii]|uniref:4499_t:CDS:1 n=1 Tax=Ambispora gerdemannii TaxID=144530 RepID=A0A9N9FDA5_9GLOM|nr:4499_t:CDS:2 [Ambispora gerdemannii]